MVEAQKHVRAEEEERLAELAKLPNDIVLPQRKPKEGGKTVTVMTPHHGGKTPTGR